MYICMVVLAVLGVLHVYICIYIYVHKWGVYPQTSLDAHLIMATPKKLHLKNKYTSSTRMEY